MTYQLGYPRPSMVSTSTDERERMLHGKDIRIMDCEFKYGEFCLYLLPLHDDHSAIVYIWLLQIRVTNDSFVLTK